MKIVKDFVTNFEAFHWNISLSLFLKSESFTSSILWAILNQKGAKMFLELVGRLKNIHN